MHSCEFFYIMYFNKENKMTKLEQLYKNGDRIELISAIISKKFLDEQNKYERTLFILAANDGDLEICKLLYENGADCTIKDKYSLDSLFTAVSMRRHDVVQFLVDTKKFNLDTSYQRNTCLAEAAFNQDYEMIEILAKGGANVNLLTDNIGQKIPLTHCALFSSEYLEYDEKSSIKNFKKTPTFLSIKALSDAGIKMNAHGGRDGEGLVLSVLRIYGMKEAKEISKIGADVNHKDKNGNTALHYFAEIGNYEYCEFLIKKMNADISIKNKSNKTAADVKIKFNINKNEFDETKNFLSKCYKEHQKNEKSKSL